MEIRPFQALRPTAEVAPAMAALPYDVVEVDDARAAMEAEPRTFLSVDVPEVLVDKGTDPYAPGVYAAARDRFQAWRDQGLLEKDPEPAFYVYQEVERAGDGAGHRQTGLVASVAVDAFVAGDVRRHESTRVEKEADRIRHVAALGAQTGPAFLMADGETSAGRTLAALLEKATEAAPLYGFTDAQGVENRLWRVDDTDLARKLAETCRGLGRLYIADGHHRSASAVKTALGTRRGALPEDPGELASVDVETLAASAGTGDEGVLSVIFPSTDLRLLAYDRVVGDLAGLRPDEFLAAVAEAGFTLVESAAPVRPDRPHVIGLFLGGRWWRASMGQGLVDELAGLPAPQRLDVAVIQERLLGPVLAIDDPRSDPRIDFVGGSAGFDELEARAGAEGVALTFCPTTTAQIMAVADEGGSMPPKSTWFEPKLRSGLFFKEL